MAQGLLAGENPNKNLFNYFRNAEGYVGDYKADPSKKSQQKNIGFGVKATKEVRELRELFIANGVEPEVVDDMLLRKSMQEHKERAREAFNKDIRRHHTTGGPTQIPFDKQPLKVQELLTELEFNGGLSGWPKLMKNAKSGDYQGVEKEMDLSVEKSTNKEGTKRRNRLRNEYFSDKLMAEPKLRLADAYGNVELDEKHSLWPDATMFGLPKNPIDYLFGNDRQQQEQRPQMPPQVGLPPQFAMENIGNIDPQRMPPQQQMQPQQMQPQQQMPTLQQQAQTAQVQPALNPFPWLNEVSGSYGHPAIDKSAMYPQKKRFKSRSMYPQPKNF